MNTRSSDMDLITDMFDTPYDDNIESNMDEHYYVGKAENILKQLDETTKKYNYYINTYITPDGQQLGYKKIIKIIKERYFN